MDPRKPVTVPSPAAFPIIAHLQDYRFQNALCFFSPDESMFNISPVIVLFLYDAFLNIYYVPNILIL